MLDSDETPEQIYERLKAYPNLLQKVKEMLDLVEKEKVESADDFEEALIPKVRGFGKELIQTWAACEEDGMREDLESKGTPHLSKKNSTGIPHLGKQK